MCVRMEKGIFQSTKKPRRRRIDGAGVVVERENVVPRIPRPNSCVRSQKERKKNRTRKGRRRQSKECWEWDPQCSPIYLPSQHGHTSDIDFNDRSALSLSLSLSLSLHMTSPSSRRRRTMVLFFFFSFFPHVLMIFLFLIRKEKSRNSWRISLIVQWETIVFINDGLWRFVQQREIW